MNRSSITLQTVVVALIAILVFILGWLSPPWTLIISGVIDLLAFGILLMRTTRTIPKVPLAERFTGESISPIFAVAETYKFPILLGTSILTLFLLLSNMDVMTQLLAIGAVLGYFEISFLLKSTQQT